MDDNRGGSVHPTFAPLSSACPHRRFRRFEAEPPSLSSDAQSERKGGEEADTILHSRHVSSSGLATGSFLYEGPITLTSDTVAQVAGITGRSSPAPEWWGRRPGRSFGTGEEQPSSLATADGESHIKAPPSTSEPVRVSEVGRGRLLTLVRSLSGCTMSRTDRAHPRRVGRNDRSRSRHRSVGTRTHLPG